MEQEPQEGGRQSLTGAVHPRDGTLDFSGYSLAQLEDLRDTLDRGAFPASFATLGAEIERRRSDAPVGAPEEAREPVRFTPGDGLRGCLQALRRRLPLFGAGALEIRDGQLLLQGWQLTWLGVPHRTLLGIPLDKIRHVARDEDWVRFQWRRPVLGCPVELQAASPQAAQSLVARLPVTQTARTQQHWTQMRELTRRLGAVSPSARVTPILVLVNVALYLVLLALTLRTTPLDPTRWAQWGANFGALTLDGQWWRLLSAQFLHWTPLHLLVNMWVLWNVGRLTERLYGSGPYLLLYVCSAVVSSSASLLWDPSVVSMGASGAIFGVLGAFLAFILRRRGELPARLWRAHWISAAVLVLYSLVDAFYNVQIDNAAHVGGLVGGLGLGWLLARALDARARSRFPFREMLATLMLAATAAALLLSPVISPGPWPSERYFRAHEWYTRGVNDIVGRTQEILVAENNGQISDTEAGRRFGKEILPFWSTTAERLKKETVPASQGPAASLLTRLAGLRLEAAQLARTVISEHDRRQAAELQRINQRASLIEARITRLQLRASMSYRARGLSQSAPVLAMRARLTGHPWKCVKAPSWLDGQTAASDSRGDGPALREAAACLAQRLFMAADYAGLEGTIRRAAAHRADLPDGGSTLAALHGGLDTLFTYGHIELLDILTRTAAWQRERPASGEPDLAEADLFEAWAWDARGHGGAGDVSQQQWTLFALRLEMAAASLEGAQARAHAWDPEWYVLSLAVGLGQSKDVDVLQGLFQAGIQAFPDYHPLYRGMLRILMPRWVGSYERVNTLIRDLSQGHGPTDAALYADLYLMYADLERDDVNIFRDALAEWPLMRQGLIELHQRHPQSDYTLNLFARSACVAEDWAQYAALRPQLQEHTSQLAWTQKTTLLSCDAGARLAAPAADASGSPPVPTGTAKP